MKSKPKEPLQALRLTHHHSKKSMHNYLFISVLFTLLLSINSGKISGQTITFQPTYAGEAIELNKPYHARKTDSNIRFDLLKFYLSDLAFYQDGLLIHAPERKHWLIDAEEPESLIFKLDSVDLSKVNRLVLNLGVDSLTNVSGALGGDLDPTKGMYWSWQSGYVNFKIEGSSPACPARKNRFQFHVGGYEPEVIPLQRVELEVTQTNDLVIKLDLAPLFQIIDLRGNYQIMRPGTEAVELAKLVAAGFEMSTKTEER